MSEGKAASKGRQDWHHNKKKNNNLGGWSPSGKGVQSTLTLRR